MYFNSDFETMIFFLWKSLLEVIINTQIVIGAFIKQGFRFNSQYYIFCGIKLYSKFFNDKHIIWKA